MSLLIAEHAGLRIRATGSYLPRRVVTSEELAARTGAPLTAAQIEKLTGIRERRWAAPDQATSDLAIEAGRTVLDRAGVSHVDRLIVGTTSPDHPIPACACFVQRGLSLAPAPAFDVAAACGGFLFGLDLAARSVLTGDRSVLVLAADIRSRLIDPDDRGTFALFGDGAGGLLLERGAVGEGLLAVHLMTDGEGAEVIHVPAGGSRRPTSTDTAARREHFLKMVDGPRVFLTALEGMSQAAHTLLDAMRLTLDDIDLVVPHQPNRLILDRLARYLRIPRDKVFVNVHRTGNMSAASLAVATDEALTSARLRPGANVLLVGGGAGFCAGAALLRIPGESK